jgi:hypothetical protein
VDAGCCPKQVGCGHLTDQTPDCPANFRSPLFGLDLWVQNRRKPWRYQDTTISGLHQGWAPVLPGFGETHPEEAVRRSQPRPRTLSLEHGKAVAGGPSFSGAVSRRLAGRTRTRSREATSAKHSVEGAGRRRRESLAFSVIRFARGKPPDIDVRRRLPVAYYAKESP